MSKTKLTVIFVVIGIAAVYFCYAILNETPAQRYDRGITKQPHDGSLPMGVSTAPEIKQTMAAPEASSRAINSRERAKMFVLPAENVALLAIVEDLKKASAEGSVPATCRLAFELGRCNEAQDIEKAASNSEFLTGRLPPSSPGYTARMAQDKSLREEASIATRVCAGLPMTETADAWKYALAAAQSSHLPSMIRYVRRYGIGLNTGDPAVTAEGWLAYKQTAPTILQNAIDQGSPEAMEYAAFMHLRENASFRIVPYDPILGITYYLVLKSFASAPYAAVLDQNIQYSMAEKKISTTEMSQANLRAQTLMGKLSQTPMGTLDFTKGISLAKDGSHCKG